jgi:predicted Zn-dependent protease
MKQKPRRTQMLEKLIADARRIHPRRKILTIALAIVAAGYLMTIKQGAVQEQQTLEEVKVKQAERREATNAEINDAMGDDFGGPSTNKDQVALVARVAATIIEKTDAGKAAKPMRVMLLAEPDHINLYGLSSGEIYLTTALLNRMRTEGQLASMLAHAAAHVMAADGLALLPENPKIPKPIWQYKPEAETKADVLTITLLSQAGYDPYAFGRALTILAEAYHAGADASFFTTHPSAADREKGIEAAIKQVYPEGLPEILSK